MSKNGERKCVGCKYEEKTVKNMIDYCIECKRLYSESTDQSFAVKDFYTPQQ